MRTENIQNLKNLSFQKIIGEIEDYAILLLSKDGIIENWNSGAEKIKGYKSEEIIGKSFSVFYTEKDKNEGKPQKLLALAKNEGKARDEGWRKRKNGTSFWASVLITAIHDDYGNIIGFTKVTRDLTLNKAEEYLNKVYTRFKIATDAAKIGIWELDLPNHILYWSEEISKIHEVSADFEPELETAINFYKEGNNRDRIREAVNVCIHNGTPFDLELKIITATGTEKWVRAMGKGKFRDGKIVRLYGAIQDINEKKLITRQLEKSQQEYKSLFDQHPDAVFALDRKGYFISFNERLLELIGISPEKLKKISFKPFCAPEDLDRVMGNFLQVLEGKPQTYQTGMITNKGKRLELNITNMPIVVDGEIVGVYGIARDITEHKKADLELKQSQENLQKIMDHSLDIICTIDREGLFKQISPASEKILGYSPKELVGIPYISLVYEEDREITTKAAEEIAAGISTTNFMNRYVRKDGRLVPIIWSVYWDNEDELFYCIARDATEKKKAESLLRESEKRITDLAQNVPGVVYQLCIRSDGSSYFTYVSDKMEEIFGFSTNEQSDEWELGNRIPDEEKEAFFSSVQKAVTELSNWDYEGRIRCGNGEMKWFQGKSIPLKVGDEVIFNGIMLDITKRKKVELEREQLIKELSQNNTELKQFSYITSHNLRAPLTNLIGIHQLLDHTRIEDEKIRRLVNGLKASTSNLNETLNDLIKILIIKENTNLTTRMIDVNERFNEVKNAISSFIKQSGAEINYNFREVPEVKFNKEYMDSILLNLITNAIKYAHPDRYPLINISTRKSEGKDQLVVQDNGLGFNMAKVKDKIFGLYQRFHNHPNSKGIGLYLVHSQVTSLGGNIEVTSEENIGTTFTITFK
ncbi:PAS domain-containing sensor histidine kinase [Flexithrix dorotheae]|uniref:PAS domain-containing sensor histidine kinase n=1 Tax=Flexithrix dorotheae TaxID=70993 RepID=UPI000363256B|nr:PAS domain-containing sensor histidine kinase [Flexithrix dorotheae]